MVHVELMIESAVRSWEKYVNGNMIDDTSAIKNPQNDVVV